MGILVYVLGRSGTGKSYSMRNFDKEDLAVINVQGKILPFKGSGKFHIVNTDDASQIVAEIESAAKKYKSIVVDDFQYVMANEFMRRSAEKGYEKFTEIGRHAWDIADCVRSLPHDVIVYVLCHTDTDQDGFERLKTIGKLLDDKIVLEGMSTIVLKTAVSDGHYTFLTQNNGHDTVKSPAGMFPSLAIENDLKYVDDKIRNYYEIGDFKSDEEMETADEVAKTDLNPEEKKSRRSRRGEEKKEEPAETPKEEAKTETTEEKSTRRSRKAENEEALSEERAKYLDAIDELNSEKGEEIPYDEVETPPVEMPKRKKRTSAENAPEENFINVADAISEAINEPETEEAEFETPVRRRRRRG
jgi:hypothetical protein